MKIRLALREEGTFWNAYLALADTMEGAKLIGSIAIGAAKKNPEIKDGFTLSWETNVAPESERSGHA